MTGKPKLLVCIGEYVPGAGQTRVVENELQALRNSYDITVVAPTFAEEAPSGVRAERVSMRSFTGFLRLARLMRAADVVHLHDTLAHMAIGTSVRRRRCVVTCHGIAPPAIRTGLREKVKGHVTTLIYPFLYRRAVRVVTISDFLGDWLRRSGVDRLSVISWGAPDEVVPPVERPKTRRLLYIGQVSYRKGFDLLLQGAALCAPDAMFDIVGSGNLAWARRLVDAHCLRDRVTLRGHLDDTTVTALLDETLAIVSFSRWEGFGLPVVEGFSRGRPAIVLGGSAMAEIVTRAGGGVVVKSPAGLPAAISEVEDNWDTLSKAALAEARRLRWSETWARYDTLFSTVLNDRSVGHR